MLSASRTARKLKTLDERFEGKVQPDRETGCLIWIGAKGNVPNSVYGQIRINGRLVSAHRVAYERAYGPIPTGKVIRHICNRPLCVNPEHLVAGTQKENMNDKVLAGRALGGRGKLTSKDATAIVGMRMLGFTREEIAKDFNVSMSTVQQVLRHITWPNAIDEELDKDLSRRKELAEAPE